MTQIQLRRDTAANWASVNPVLASGEPAFETDTGKFKIGDGITAYNSLDYIGAGDLPDNITTQGNTFNGAGQLVQLDSSGKLPAIDGSQLTNIPSSTPSNMVTTDTDQTITGSKIFSALGVTTQFQLGTPIRLRGNSGYQSAFSAQNGKHNKTLVIGTTSSSGAKWEGLTVSCAQRDTSRPTQGVIQITDGTNSYTVIDTGNFATSAPTGNLKYWTGTETEYTAITTKDPDTLYRTTDTNKVYLGTIQLGGA